MKTLKIKTYTPKIADYGEPEMVEHGMGAYVHLHDYMSLYKKYIRARSEASKNKTKLQLSKNVSR